ncbi:FAD-dependent monooxygenase [Mycobacterium sp. PDNC021]|uniref:FAD-dependent monooxygenase n=1 Tax=Mycobacterium sp. PDNC021 TaxID=3391399 RepID=UPI003AB0BB88
MTTATLHARVLIVGAGPVGMTLACELRTAGVEVDIISHTRRHSPHSRATIIWPRVLELLDRVGIAEPIIARGHYFDQMNYYSGKHRIGLIRFDRLPDIQYPFAVTCPQWKIEQAIEDRLTALGGHIAYDHEFIAGNQTPDSVTCTIKEPDGQCVERTYNFVIGADGYHSAVRDAFGFQFAGETLRTRLAITDAHILGETTSSEAAYYLTRGGNMVLAPLGDGVFRVGTTVPDNYTGPDQPTRAFFEDMLRQRVPGQRRLGEMRFSGIFNANIRAASTYSRGRVILCGDSAHSMSPSGAQGLNTGLQDAANLGWKLAGVIEGRFPQRLLETYDQERRPAVATVSRLSTTLARVGLYSSTPKILARDTLYRLGTATGMLERHLAPRLAQTTTCYGPTPKPGVLTVGQRLPLRWRTTSAEPVLDLHRYTILLSPGRTYRWQQWHDFATDIEDRHSTDARVINLAGRPPGNLTPLLPVEPVVLLARPDGHLEHVLQPDLSARADDSRHAIAMALSSLVHRPHNDVADARISLSANRKEIR